MGELEALRRILDESNDPNNPDQEELRQILESVQSIAVIGVSRNPEKAARRVPTAMSAADRNVGGLRLRTHRGLSAPALLPRIQAHGRVCTDSSPADGAGKRGVESG